MLRGDSSPLRVRVLTALIVAGVFSSGAIVGAGIYRWGSGAAAPAEAHGHGVGLWMPVEELELSPEQYAKVSAIVERGRLELDAVVRESFPRVRAIDEQMQKEVKAVLTPEQQKKLEDLKRRGPVGPTPTWRKRLDDFAGEPEPGLVRPGLPPGALPPPGAPPPRQ